MRIEAVTVCLHYDDFLEETIRVNQPHIDDWVIVTAKEDEGTIRVCQRYGVRTAFCPYFRRGGDDFNKALAINIGLAHLALKDWVLHIDADTALPRNASKHLANVELDPLCIYGIDRVDCPNEREWDRYLLEPNPYEKHYFYQPPRRWPLGSRVGHFDYGGYVPIGFFQLWNRASGITRYPAVQGWDAEHTDMLHGLQWPRPRRVLIPEVLAVHLSTGAGKWGPNWRGRKTPRFRAGGPGEPTGHEANPKTPYCH